MLLKEKDFLFNAMGILTFLAKRYIAGDSIEDALQAAKKLNQQGILVTLDILGEAVLESSSTEAATQQYIDLLEAIAREKVKADISLKLSMLGLDINEELCIQHVQKILNKATSLNNFVWFDMESSAYTERTIAAYIDLLRTYKNIGIAIQSCLFRSVKDVKKLANLQSHVRLVKGAYKEPADIAFEKKEHVDVNYRMLMKMLMHGSGFTAIATHDITIIQEAIDFAKKENISNDKLEFQMLYGIRRDYWQKLINDGFTVRIYVPFGPKWLPYMLRRLRERRENIFFVLRHLF